MTSTTPKRRIGRPTGAEPTLSVAEAAEVLGKSIFTVYEYTTGRKMCSDGKPLLPSRRVGGSVRIPCRAVTDEAFNARWAMLLDRGRSAHWRKPAAKAVTGGEAHA